MSSLLLALALIACSDKGAGDTGGPDTTDGGGTDGGTTDGGSTDGGTTDGGTTDGGTTDGGSTDGGTTDGGSTDGGSTGGTAGDYLTYGPALPDCTPAEGAGTQVALSGVVLLPDGPAAGSVVYDRDSGLITCAGEGCDHTDAEVICTEGIISPGLINAHDHMQYNVLYPWQHDELFEDRYEWQAADSYDDYRAAYLDMADRYTCEIMKWGELRNVVAGATAVVGSSGSDDCIAPLMRNLDEGYTAHGIDGYDMYYGSGRPSNYDENEWWIEDVASGDANCSITHVAEGINQSVRYEIDHMFDIGAAGEGFAYVHATDADTTQLARMAETGTTIVWSPRSNLDLYAQTTPAVLAMRLGVPVVLAPDWTWSGSTDPRNELACLDELLWTTGTPMSDIDIWRMVTDEAASLLRLDGVLGRLVEGAKADIAVYDWSDTPYRAVIDAEVSATRLVIIDGQAVYGRGELAQGLAAHPEYCETVDACGEERMVCLQDAASGDGADTYASLQAELSAALDATGMPAELDYANDLFPVFICEDVREPCDPTSPSAADADGDGVADDSDLCPAVYDPLQWDHDGDEVGDFCDPCPLNPVSDVCEHDPADIDGDGFPSEVDTCPYVYDPDQLDTDADGSGDACDRCPEDYNPDGAGCPVSVDVLSDESHPEHPAEGEAVTLSGLIVTGIRDNNGYVAQDPSLSEYAGIWVYDAGDAQDAGLEVGDEVTVSGEYTEYYGLVEIYRGDTTVTGAGSITPLVVDPCDVGTGGPDAERYEAMLLTVEGVSVTDSAPSDGGSYESFVVDGCLFVSDYLGDGWDTGPAVGTTYSSITGALIYTWDEARLAPRSAEDVVE